VFAAWFTPKAFRMARVSAWLLWQRLTRFTGASAKVELPRHLSVDHDQLVGDALGHEASVEWAVQAVSSRPRGFRGLQGNRFGLLVSSTGAPETLVFLSRHFFGHRTIRLPLAGCQLARDTTFLSEGLALYNRATRRRVLFRFPKAEAAIVDRLADDLRQRLATVEETPATAALTARQENTVSGGV